jgi:uncharacterized protein
MATAREIIEKLGLTPHPEGGWFKETFRDPETFLEDGKPRAYSTAIFYLLEAGDRSHWHKVDAIEIWHYYAGAPLQLLLSWNDGKPVKNVVLGPNVLNNQSPQVVIKRGEWQSAKSTGDWTLVGCTVSPAFEYEGFTMAKPGWEPSGSHTSESRTSSHA